MPEQAHQSDVLLQVKEHEDFLADSRDVQATLINARRFAKDVKDADQPFADHKEAGEAADQLKAMKLVVDNAEAHRKAIKDPYWQTGKAIDAEFKELLAQLRPAIEVLTKRGLAFKRQQDRIADEEEKRRREELRKREEEAVEKAQKAAERAAAETESAEAQQAAARARQVAAQATAATARRESGTDARPKQVRGGWASLSAVTDYKWDCFDVAALPDKCKTFDKKVIDALVKSEKALAKAEGREFNLQLIPGVRIWPKERGVSR